MLTLPIRRLLKILGIFAFFVAQVNMATASKVEQDATQLSVEKIDQAMKRFVRTPHPMASVEQKKLAHEMKASLVKEGWDVEILKFKAMIPNVVAEKFGGKDKKAAVIKEVVGENIAAVSKGVDHCFVLVSGHYDTKPYQNFRFVGANDGGSSTVLMQELARAIAKIRQQGSEDKVTSQGRFVDCSIGLIFFDGEEATLPEWSDGERLLGLQDNLYGSRAFASLLEKQFDGVAYKGLPIKALFVIDMVGHKNQNLFITNGSNALLTQKFLEQKTVSKIARVNISMDDDHLPFLQLGVPLVHVIDWTNISEWHSANDTIDIISSKNIADFGNMLVRFLKQRR